jgi:hypothetical protein
MNLNLDYYVYPNPDFNNWVIYYEKLFNIKINWKHLLELDPEKYDLIILLTDDDIFFGSTLPLTDPKYKIYKNSNEILEKVKDWENKYGETKLISIEHFSTIRREKVFDRIGTRFFYHRPNCKWAIPTYLATNMETKNQLLSTDKIIVTCIGKMIPPQEILKSLIVNFDSIEFNLVGRKINFVFDSPNIHVYKNLDVTKMMTLIQSSDYLFCYNQNDNDYAKLAISGSIPLAFNHGCRLIMPKSWNSYYNFKSALTYDINDKITLIKNNNLEQIYSELWELISHRNEVFDNVFKKKFDNYSNNLTSNCFLSKISKLLNKPNYNTLVCFDLIIPDFSNDFRELHFINSSDNQNKIKKNNIYYHIINQTTQLLLTKILGPSIFCLSSQNPNLELIFKMLQLRHYKDILIIINPKLFDENILMKNYDKKHVKYIMTTTNNVTNLVILNQ